jgi:mRNA-degrading endonuclease RelE of RelBE toxin-antitoxin system
VIVSRQEICFKNGDICARAANQLSSLFKEKQHVFAEKMKTLQENTKMMHRYSLNLDNMM